MLNLSARASEKCERLKREIKFSAIEQFSAIVYSKKAKEKWLLEEIYRGSKLQSETPGRFAGQLKCVKEDIAELE